MAPGFLRRWLRAVRLDAGETPVDAQTRPPEVTWEAADAPFVQQACPNCGDQSAKTPVLVVSFRALHHQMQSWRLLSCPLCTCRFLIDEGEAPRQVTDYAGDEMLSRGRAALYLQHGAGLAQLIRPIARLPHGPGTRVLDIGCGFGFGLDFAIRARGWSGLGIDPAQIAGLGRDRLGLPIEQRLLGDAEPAMQGAFDVVMAAETIEHVPDPGAFIRLLVASLKPDGVLVLTTPDAAAISPDTPSGQLAGLLSPGLHLVLQNEHSLRILLQKAGLDRIHIDHDGGALVATASATDLVLDTDPAAFSATYFAYLSQRATGFAAQDDLFWGFCGRAFQEAVNRSDWAQADLLRVSIAQGCQTQFALDFDHPALFDETAQCSLERMAALMPLNMGLLLYADGMRALGEGAERASQQHRFACAAEALHRLGRAVGALGMADPMSEAFAWSAEAESLLCAASDAPTDDLIARLTALGSAPGEIGFGRREKMRLQAFVTLVNAARYDEARALLGALPELSLRPQEMGLDACFCRAMLALQPGGDAAAALDGFAWVRIRLQSAMDDISVALFWSALRGEAQAQTLLGRPAMAASLLRDVIETRAAEGVTIPTDLAITGHEERK